MNCSLSFLCLKFMNFLVKLQQWRNKYFIRLVCTIQTVSLCMKYLLLNLVSPTNTELFFDGQLPLEINFYLLPIAVKPNSDLDFFYNFFWYHLVDTHTFTSYIPSGSFSRNRTPTFNSNFPTKWRNCKEFEKCSQVSDLNMITSAGTPSLRYSQITSK